MPTYDVIILGTGGVGSAAAVHLARRGARVLGIDQFDHGHNRGSSHGQTRAIRMAYFEHPDYVPLLRRTYSLWDELEEQTQQKLFYKVGLLEIGPADGIVVPGVLESARLYDLPVDELSRADVEVRYPGFVMPDEAIAVFERNAGFLRVEDSVLAHLQAAKQHGADFRTNESVQSWDVDGDGVVVKTTGGEYHAARLVITAGAWAGTVLSDLQIPLTVQRKHLHWYPPSDDRYSLESGTPTFFFEMADGSFFYGFPQIGKRGVKVAEHSGHGEAVDDPAEVNREVDPTDRARVDAFVKKYLHGLSPSADRHCVCMYTMTPDEHFIVDVHPQHSQVCFAAGLSGHGFKFTPVLGEALADLAFDGKTDLPIGFLNSHRFDRA